jgi:cysteine-rich repeat protein
VDLTLALTAGPALTDFTPPSNEAMKGLRRLLDTYATAGGTGASLINFFSVPGVADQDVARDIILLSTLQAGLDLLASDEFAPAFANSTNLEDYRWGKLHRIVFSSFLGGPFDVPPPGSPSNLAPDLPGFSRAGGMGAVNASSHSARADQLNEFMFGAGSARRVVATMAPSGPDVMQVIPGGESGIPGDPFQADQLPLWLTNRYHDLPVSVEDANANAVAVLTFDCGDGSTGPGEECDDGNTDSGDGCSPICTVEPTPSEVPTVSEWGLILMSLLLLTTATLVFAGGRRFATNGPIGAGGIASPPLNGNLYVKVLLATLSLVALGFVGAIALTGALSGVDIAGSLLCAPVFAYWVHLWLPRGTD